MSNINPTGNAKIVPTKAKKKMRKYIDITTENREFLMRAFGVTRQTVRNALCFDSKRGDTELAQKIRKVALQRGGVPMVALREDELEKIKK